VRVETDVLAVQLLIGDRRWLAGDSGSDLRHRRGRVRYGCGAWFRRIAPAGDGDPREGDGESGKLAKGGAAAARHAVPLCKDGTRLFNRRPFGR